LYGWAARLTSFRRCGLAGLQGREERGDFKCLGCGGENCLLVGLHDGQPGREILRVIRSRRIGDAEIGAEEGGSEFGDQLIDCWD